jgi:hypothetical protein
VQERRRYGRVAFYCPLQLSVLPDGPEVPGFSCDISIGGIGLTANVTLPRGQVVRVSFRLKDGASHETTESVLGRVAHSKADEDGDRIGIEFLEPIRDSSQPLLVQTINNLRS